MCEEDEISAEKYGFLRALVESRQGIIFSLDRNYRYIDFTRAHQETMQNIWGVEIIVGMNMLEIIGVPADREKAKTNFDRALQGENLVEEEEYGDPLLGRTMYENRYGPIRLADGSIVGLTVCVTDKSTCKKLASLLSSSEGRHRRLFETMLQGVVYQNADGTITSMNSAAERILGKTREEFLGSSSVDEEHHTIREDGSLFPGSEHPSMEALKTGETVSQVVMGVWNPRLSGYRWINISAVPLFCHGESRPSTVYTVFEDITEFKTLEEMLRETNKELEVRVAERTALLQATVNQLETEISQRHRLEIEILSISEREQCRIGLDLHEGLGQELTGISFIGDVIAKRLQSESHPLYETAANLAQSIRGTITTSRFLAKGLYPIELDRHGLLVALEDLAHRTQEQYGIACHFVSAKLPDVKKSAEIHIFRIVQECVINAIKHAGASQITIEAWESERGGSFAVTDDGIGFDPSKKKSGMGLDIMEYRMREIGGEISLEKPPRGGSCVLCFIPA